MSYARRFVVTADSERDELRRQADAELAAAPRANLYIIARTRPA